MDRHGLDTVQARAMRGLNTALTVAVSGSEGVKRRAICQQSRRPAVRKTRPKRGFRGVWGLGREADRTRSAAIRTKGKVRVKRAVEGTVRVKRTFEHDLNREGARPRWPIRLAPSPSRSARRAERGPA